MRISDVKAYGMQRYNVSASIIKCDYEILFRNTKGIA